MAAATFIVTPGQIKGGAYYAKLATLDLGALTRDGITLRLAEEWIDGEVDQYGAGPVSRINAGGTLEFSFTLEEFDFQVLREILPQGLRTIQTTPARDKVEWPRVVSGERTITGQALVLHPVGLGDAIVTDDITIHNAVFTGGVEVTLGNNVRGFQVSGMGLRDTSQGGRILTIGDTAATGTGT